MPLDLTALKKILGSGLLAFPVTHFKSDLSFDEQPYRRSIHDNIGHGAAGLFAPGGTGEFFSLTMPEAERVMRAAVEASRGRVPVVGGAGYGTAIAIDFAKAAELVYKDGHGDVEQLVRVRQMVGDRLVYIGGMPTAEVFAVPYFAAGFTTYSSAVFQFYLKTARPPTACWDHCTCRMFRCAIAARAMRSASSRPACESLAAQPAPFGCP
jgi:dihydrodipicolinate synthase/N-acetylneuraminate lyase